MKTQYVIIDMDKEHLGIENAIVEVDGKKSFYSEDEVESAALSCSGINLRIFKRVISPWEFFGEFITGDNVLLPESK